MTITANDEPTEIEADVDKRFSSIVVNLPVQQTGTGTPSPTNPRPFTVWTDVSLYVSDTEEADEPTLSIELPTPLYGGKIDMVRGEIATTYNSKESGTGWEMTEEGQFRCQVSAYNNGDETSTNVADLYAVHYETVSNKDAYDATDDLTCGLATIDGTTYLYVNDAQYTTLETFATQIADEVFVFRAHIPMSDVTEPHIVYLPEGTSYVWADAGFVDYTVSGTPPLYLPNSLGKPLKAWEVALSPYQDLHGYDSPWPAGGGKNKFQTTAESKEENGVTWTVNADGTITVSGSATDFTSLAAGVASVNSGMGNITISGISETTNISWSVITLYDSNDTLLATLYGGGSNPSLTFDMSSYATADHILVGVKRNNNTTVSGTIKIQVEQGTTATAWKPFSNICPIYGTDKLNLFVEESYDPSATPKAVLTLPSTVYTATIGSEGGESRSAAYEDNGSGTWTKNANTEVGGSCRFEHTLAENSSWTNSNSPAEGAMCETLKCMGTGQIYGGNDNTFGLYNTRLYVRIAGITEVSDLLAHFAVQPLKVVYPCVTSTEFPITAPDIPTPKGTAYTWATAEDGTVESMEVTYVGKPT